MDAAVVFRFNATRADATVYIGAKVNRIDLSGMTGDERARVAAPLYDWWRYGGKGYPTTRKERL